MLIGCCFLIKTWTIGFALYLVLRRDWKALVVCVCVCAGGIAASFSLIGWHEWTAFRAVTLDFAKRDVLRSHSFIGMGKMYFSQRFQTVPLLDSVMLYWAFLVAGFGALLAGTIRVARLPRSPDPYDHQLLMGFVILTVLLSLPVTHVEYLIFGLPMLWMMIAPSFGSVRVSSRVQVLAVLSYCLWTRNFGSGFSNIPPDYRVAPRSLLLSTGFLGAILLWGIGFSALLKGRTRARRDQSLPEPSGPPPHAKPLRTGTVPVPEA